MSQFADGEEYKRQFPETMTRSEFGNVLINYWYSNYNDELMIAEVRPMRDYSIRHGNWTNDEDYLASLPENERHDPWSFTAWCETYPDEDDPMMNPQNAISAVTGEWMSINDRHLFILSNVMANMSPPSQVVELVDKDWNPVLDEDGNPKTAPAYGKENTMHFVYWFNFSVYTMVVDAHEKFKIDTGESPLGKAVQRFQSWFLENNNHEDIVTGMDVMLEDAVKYHPIYCSDEGSPSYTIDEKGEGITFAHLSEGAPSPVGQTIKPIQRALDGTDNWEDVKLTLVRRVKGDGRLLLKVEAPSVKDHEWVEVDFEPKTQQVLTLMALSAGNLFLPTDLLSDFPDAVDMKYRANPETGSPINKMDVSRLRTWLRDRIHCKDNEPDDKKLKPISDYYKSRKGWEVVPEIRLGSKMWSKITGHHPDEYPVYYGDASHIEEDDDYYTPPQGQRSDGSYYDHES